jgi:hypothetical protein
MGVSYRRGKHENVPGAIRRMHKFGKDPTHNRSASGPQLLSKYRYCIFHYSKTKRKRWSLSTRFWRLNTVYEIHMYTVRNGRAGKIYSRI